jgi:hypothetical protein
MLLDGAGRIRSADGLDFVAFADPRAPGLPALPRSTLEVLQVAGMFAEFDAGDAARFAQAKERLLGAEGKSSAELGSLKGAHFALFLGPQASEHALETSPEVRRARILHLACHGIADTQTPQLSHLALSPVDGAAGAEDGRLYVNELGDLPLDCELLCLSACQTNAGTLQPLEGVLGLSRAGLAAGAQAVLSTLWEVEDTAASELMRCFYDHWIRGGLPRLEALSRTKREALRQGLPISTWSAYVLFDAPRSSR